VNGTREISPIASVSYILIAGESFMPDVTRGECYDGVAPDVTRYAKRNIAGCHALMAALKTIGVNNTTR